MFCRFGSCQYTSSWRWEHNPSAPPTHSHAGSLAQLQVSSQEQPRPAGCTAQGRRYRRTQTWILEFTAAAPAGGGSRPVANPETRWHWTWSRCWARPLADPPSHESFRRAASAADTRSRNLGPARACRAEPPVRPRTGTRTPRPTVTQAWTQKNLYTQTPAGLLPWLSLGLTMTRD